MCVVYCIFLRYNLKMANIQKNGTIILCCVLSTKIMVGVLEGCLEHFHPIGRRILTHFLQDGASL